MARGRIVSPIELRWARLDDDEPGMRRIDHMAVPWLSPPKEGIFVLQYRERVFEPGFERDQWTEWRDVPAFDPDNAG